MANELLVVVPALNEQATVGAVVQALRSELDADVLVVDDGSWDRTAAEARAAGARVAHHAFNLGVGSAMRTGFRYAQRRSYRALVQVDADGQHRADEVTELVAPVLAGDADVVVGSRFAGSTDAPYPMSAGRRMAMRWLSRRVTRKLGTPITDTTSGFRAFGPAAIDRFATGYPSAYLSDTVEALLLAGDWGLTVVEQPARMHPRAAGEPSNNTLRSTWHLIRLTVVIALFRVREPLTMGARR